MSQAGKASIKKGKPSYFMSILGVTLVLFFLGIVGCLIIKANKFANYFKEKIEIKAQLRPNLNPKDSQALMEYVSAKPYIKEIHFITKEMAKEEFLGKSNQKDWDGILDANPLPAVIRFRVNKEYINVDSLKAIQNDLDQQTYVTNVIYPEKLVVDMNNTIHRWSLYLFAIAILLAIVVIILIDNTIRLAMFSNRFLIKTMQMVGATRWFIAKPMDIRGIINGAISGVIAGVAIFILTALGERKVPDLAVLDDNGTMALLYLTLIIIGILISLFSTHRSVIKYLRMKLDDLY